MRHSTTERISSHFTQFPARVTARAAVLLGIVLLAACASSFGEPLPQPAAGSNAPPQSIPAQSTAATPIAARQQLRLQEAELIIHVGKAGRLARLGHNHLVASDQLEGEVWLDASGGLHAQMEMRVTTLEVDNPERRAAYSAAPDSSDFATAYRSVPSAKNIADTRTNMLSERVLDAANYPVLRASAVALNAATEFDAANAGSLVTEFTLEVRDHQTTQNATLHWSRPESAKAGAEESGVAWHCQLILTHNQLGLTPFSALGGALRVADTLTIELRGRIAAPTDTR